MTTAAAPAIAQARAILSAAGIDTADPEQARAAYREYAADVAAGLPIAAGIPLRLTTGPGMLSVSVDAWQAKVAGPVLNRLAAASATLTAAGWSVVRLSPDAFRADPPEEAARIARVTAAAARTIAVRRLAQLAGELSDLADTLGRNTPEGLAAGRAAVDLAAQAGDQ